jgi:hypothetical protein
MANLKEQIQEAMKVAMRSQAKERLGVIRLILAAIKQQEVDKRIQLNEEQVLEILAKMVKQRKESIIPFQAAGREDLVAKENFEITVINEFLPAKLSIVEIEKLIEQALTVNNASSIKDMAKVMKYLREQLIGRADLEEVGKLVKDHLLKV